MLKSINKKFKFTKLIICNVTDTRPMLWVTISS